MGHYDRLVRAVSWPGHGRAHDHQLIRYGQYLKTKGAEGNTSAFFCCVDGVPASEALSPQRRAAHVTQDRCQCRFDPLVINGLCRYLRVEGDAQ